MCLAKRKIQNSVLHYSWEVLAVPASSTKCYGIVFESLFLEILK